MNIQRYRTALIVGFLLILWAYALFVPVIWNKQGEIFYLKPGATRSDVINELSERGLVRLSPLYYLYVYLRFDAQLKTTEYFFPQYSSPFSIWRQLTTRTGIFYRHFTIIPGKTFNQIRELILQSEGLRAITADWDEKRIMSYLGSPEIPPEGQFLPETYYYTRDTADIIILKRAFDLMQSKLDEAWDKREPNLFFKNKYQALIVASLVEKEAYFVIERPIIAGVILNRLQKNMRLQIDPTVIYGLGNRYDGKIHKKDLLENTPFNTYVNKGLPPTPIAMPGLESIEAAMHPAQHEFIYFVAKGDGSHQFSKTLPEHDAAVKAAIVNKALGKNVK